MPERLTFPSYDDGACHIRVGGRTVGFALANFSGWTAYLWPVADTRPDVTDETVRALRLRDLRDLLRRRLDETGPWWTTPREDTPMADDLNRIRRDAKDVATRRVVTDHILPTLSRLIVEDIPAMADELERLTEERDAARLVSKGRTMEQYDTEAAIDKALDGITYKVVRPFFVEAVMSAIGPELERLREERDALKAATEQVCGRLDWLIANGFGARTADLVDLRAALDHPTEETPDPADYILVTYGLWDSSGHQCGDLTPGGCDEPVPSREVTVGGKVIGRELGDCPNHPTTPDTTGETEADHA